MHPKFLVLWTRSVGKGNEFAYGSEIYRKADRAEIRREAALVEPGTLDAAVIEIDERGKLLWPGPS